MLYNRAPTIQFFTLIEAGSTYNMLGILRRSSVSNISAIILRWIFYYSKFFGVSNFQLKTTAQGILQVRDSSQRWKWFLAIHRLGFLIVYLYIYIYWIVHLNDWAEIAFNISRMVMKSSCNLCMLWLQFFQGKELAKLINGFLRIFERVRDMCHHQNQNPKRMVFGGKHELILLSLMIFGLIHDTAFLIGEFPEEEGCFYKLCWIWDLYISISIQLLMYFVVVWYLALGLQFSDLNDFVRTQLRSQLEVLEANPNRKKLRVARMTLNKCLTLHQDLLSLTTRFQRTYDLMFFLALIYNCAELTVITYIIVVQQRFNWYWMCFETAIKILNIIILCLSVQRALLHFSGIRGLMMENCYLSDIKDWHRTVDMFFTHLTLHELRVCPLGLFKVSNELLLIFFSAIVNYFTVIIQYGMQQRAVSRTLEHLKRVNSI